MAFRSTVGDLISFTALENPPWRKPGETWSYDQMLREIIDCQNQWNSFIIDADLVKDVKERFKLEYCITNTDPPRDETKKETRNLMDLLRYFDILVTEEEEQHQSHEESGSENQLGNIGLVEKSMLEHGHRIAVERIATKKGCTGPGVFSDMPRFTSYKGEEYWYQQPEDMANAVDLILDRANSLITESKCKNDDETKIGGIFKSVAWLLFELLDLHPFGNGNGRLCRVLCSYILSSYTPFPSPIYFPCIGNVESDDHSQCPQPCKDVYEQALVDARTSDKRHPCKLLTMIVYCNWKMWKKFMEEIKRAREIRGNT